jgi:hypothetical protein
MYIWSGPEAVNDFVVGVASIGGWSMGGVVTFENEVVHVVFSEEVCNVRGQNGAVEVTSNDDLVTHFKPFRQLGVKIVKKGFMGVNVAIDALEVLFVL